MDLRCSEVLRACQNQIDWDRLEKEASKQRTNGCSGCVCSCRKNSVGAHVAQELLSQIDAESRITPIGRKLIPTLFRFGEQPGDLVPYCQSFPLKISFANHTGLSRSLE